ncbi:MAG: iron complex outermembrane receptor protein [Bacteroidia bacterium]|jgi:iron complex outermembrane receptor protein
MIPVEPDAGNAAVGKSVSLDSCYFKYQEMKKFSLLICAVISLSLSSIGQTMVSGSVYTSQPKKPVAYALVRLTDSLNTYGAYCDESGEFNIENVKPGTYIVEVSHVEYETVTLDWKIQSQPVHRNFELKSEFQYLDAAVIEGVRASRSTPVTATNLNKSQIQELDQQKDFPFLLNLTPSTVVSSQAGNGVGYTGVRVRGIDPTRVNVTINGIPLNDPESQGVYWVNLPDLSSSSQSVQVQRGIGASTNGGAAFGASVNIRTNDLDTLKQSRVVLGTGSFNTNRVSLTHNSGRLKHGWGYQIRTSFIESNGYVDRATSDLKSANIIVAKYWEKASLKTNILLGSERTYQAWYGIPQPKFNHNTAEINRYVNQLGLTGDVLENMNRSNSKTYNYYTYENQVDHYNQNHYQLFYDYTLNSKWSMSSAAYITTGAGYYEQFQSKDDLSDYGLPIHVSGQDTFEQADIIRRRWLDNTLVGVIANGKFVGKKLMANVGAGYNSYSGRHFGEVIATEFTGYEDLQLNYYDNDAKKNEFNAYGKIKYPLGKWIPYLDVQVRQVDYQFDGLDNNLEFGNQRVDYLFINPKVGLTYNAKRSRVYAMVAQGNREPVRDDFRNNKPTDWPDHEMLNNLEVGYRYNKARKQFGVTVYYMDYTNQLVLTGAVNDVGESIRTNVSASTRQGVELEWQYPLSKSLQFGGNATFASNKIESFTEYVGEWDGNYDIIQKEYSNTDISFSPSAIAMGMLRYKVNGAFQMDLITKYVGKQYLDNTESANRMLDDFTTIDIAIRYVNPKIHGLKSLHVALYLNNVLNQIYAPDGYTYSGYLGGQRQSFNYVYPMAGRNLMLKASIDL